MEKALCYGALGVAVLMLVVFVLDMAAGFPFGRGAGSNPFVIVDVFGLIASLMLGYIAWNASRDLK